jgi:SAM-dependent methyltransferase
MPSSTTPLKASFPDVWREDAVCPNCAGRGLRIFFEVPSIPVHSCLLMDSREQAVAYPRGDLRLGFCPACGFVTNTAFDVAHNEYSTSYEETQGFSSTFNRFAEGLARDLVVKWDLAGRRVLEIGCGKGEFLVKMCELGGCRGIGIDPAYRPERTTSEAAARIEFIQDLYDRRYAHLEADCIVCRHTLEHIAPTLDFMRELRRTIGDRRDTIVFFELPDVMRELCEGAFWDLYYEHCTYFSCGSLARLFRATGFDVLELELAYGGQYILLTAKPADGVTAPVLEVEDDLVDLVERIAAFPALCEGVMRRWRDFADDYGDRRKKLVVWGSGSKGVSFLTSLGLTDQIDCVVDINPYRQGKFMPGTGHEIVAPAHLASHPPDGVIVMNPIYLEDIRRDLEAMGLRPELVVV